MGLTTQHHLGILVSLCFFLVKDPPLSYPCPLPLWIFLVHGGWVVPVAHSIGVGTSGQVWYRVQALKVGGLFWTETIPRGVLVACSVT